LEIGLVISLLITFVAFEWKQEEISVSNLEDTTEIEAEEEIIPITQETPPPPPAEVKIPILSDQIDIVDDNIELENNIINLEDDASLGVEIQDYVEVVEEVVEEEAIPFQLVEEKPSFNGGDANMFSRWVNERLVYPEIAKENGVQGRVTLQFTVEKDGRVTKVKVSNLEDTTQVITEEEIIPITQETPPPPPSAPKIPILSDQIDIVDDEIELDDDMFMNLEDDASIGVEIMDYVEVEEEVVEEEAIPFQLVEEKPSFQGGDANQFSKWVNSRLVYPEIAKENGVQGRVTLQFTVEKDGSVTKVKVLRGVDPSLDKEAVRVVSMSPKWKPGKQRDRAVPVTYTFPVIFQLR
jgi:protein TonB